MKISTKFNGKITYPPIYAFKYRISGLIKHPLEDNSAHHDGYGESWRSPEEQIVDTSYERHVGQWSIPEEGAGRWAVYQIRRPISL